MAIAQPVGGDALSNNHVDMHRIIACDPAAPVKSIAVNSDGTVDIIGLAAGGPLYVDVTTGRLVLNQPKYGGMYAYEASVDLTIDAQSVYHALYGSNQGTLSGFTFTAGLRRSISSVAQNVAGVSIKINTSAAHNLSAGEIITVQGTNTYDGVREVLTVESSTQITVTGTYVATSTGALVRPDTLKASVGSAGVYLCSMSFTADTNNNVEFKFEMNINTTAQDNIVVEENFEVGSGYESLSTSGIITVAEGDYIWASCENNTGTQDINFRHGNINLVRLT